MRIEVAGNEEYLKVLVMLGNRVHATKMVRSTSDHLLLCHVWLMGILIAGFRLLDPICGTELSYSDIRCDWFWHEFDICCISHIALKSHGSDIFQRMTPFRFNVSVFRCEVCSGDFKAQSMLLVDGTIFDLFGRTGLTASILVSHIANLGSATTSVYYNIHEHYTSVTTPSYPLQQPSSVSCDMQFDVT